VWVGGWKEGESAHRRRRCEILTTGAGHAPSPSPSPPHQNKATDCSDGLLLSLISTRRGLPNTNKQLQAQVAQWIPSRYQKPGLSMFPFPLPFPFCFCPWFDSWAWLVTFAALVVFLLRERAATWLSQPQQQMDTSKAAVPSSGHGRACTDRSRQSSRLVCQWATNGCCRSTRGPGVFPPRPRPFSLARGASLTPWRRWLYHKSPGLLFALFQLPDPLRRR
jgi:hypothetical protein